MTKRMDNNLQKNRFGEIIFLVILALYPLRHIHWGLDFWDTGYNYANFEYMGLEHMDSMWLYSTYLANAVGHFLTKLPIADCLIGMNFYTGLFVSGLALLGYWFCTRKLNIPGGIAFLGELAAISLCWCPTALLYNYLTYLLFLACFVLLYEGLVKEKKWYLFWAGICLGSNVLVRFPNVTEAAFIVAVWAYGFIEFLEERKYKGKTEDKPETEGQSGGEEKSTGAGKRTLQRTLWCLGGYLTALLVFLGYIAIRYGLNNYVQGILRLFAMTDNATDYKPDSMLTSLIYTYVENLYWVARIAAIVAAGTVMFALGNGIFALVKYLVKRFFKKNADAVCKGLNFLMHLCWVAVCIAMLGWLYYRGFCSLEFYSYGSMLRPGILFLMLSMGIALLRIFYKGAPKEEKLVSGMLILVILLTSIGSNNGVYPSLNNLFVAAPYTFWQCCRFVCYVEEKSWKGIVISAFPAKGVLVTFLAMFVAQSVQFGAEFVFAEATGVQNVSAEVENNRVLAGVKMHPDRAKWMSEISAFAEENDLKGKEVILYGQLPSLSYYLEMPSAFNPWSDLRSYSYGTMEQDLSEVEQEMKEDAAYHPVVILEDKYGDYLADGWQIRNEDAKWDLLQQFMQSNGYQETFRNEKFSVWEVTDR
ncbi:MAG: hypothetical protein II994_00450 [Lachnospiraceae bacterium]|nr:hypothetical protein [Lachnospiraceae bacterium]